MTSREVLMGNFSELWWICCSFATLCRSGQRQSLIPVKDCIMAPFTSRPDFLVASLILFHKSLKVPGDHLISSHLLRTSPRKLNTFTKLNSMLVSVQLLSHVWLRNPMDCSTPGFPVHHQLPEHAQTHVHWVGGAIQPSHPLPSHSSTFNLSQHRGLFQWVSSLHQVAKVLEFQLQHQSFQWIFRTDFL